MNKLGFKKIDLVRLNDEFREKSPNAVLEHVFKSIRSPKILLASSLSIEDQVLTDMVLKIDSKARIFFIDTGRHFQETYDLMETNMKKYHFNYEVYAPERQDIEKAVSELGPNFFYESVELRKRCCEIRKVKPLQRALSTVDAWICGLRREQSATRQDIEIFEWDETNSIYKINPIAYWNEEQVWGYIKSEGVPYNNLYNKDFCSIGCQPCTRSVGNGEDVRSGRWWWEDPDKKECGLHKAK